MTNTCTICNKPFECHRVSARFCPACYRLRSNEQSRVRKAAKRTPKPTHTKHCIVCGKPFHCPPSWADARKTCSRECSAVIQRQHIQNRPDLEEKRIAGIMASPATSHTPMHVKAKSYTLRSPTGEVYRLRNLKLWVEQNAHLYDGTPTQAYNGLLLVKKTLAGTRTKSTMRHWRGWTVVEWEE